eukprot:ANDGO_04273.mRNA.1 hypothetical protein
MSGYYGSASISASAIQASVSHVQGVMDQLQARIRELETENSALRSENRALNDGLEYVLLQVKKGQTIQPSALRHLQTVNHDQLQNPVDVGFSRFTQGSLSTPTANTTSSYSTDRRPLHASAEMKFVGSGSASVGTGESSPVKRSPASASGTGGPAEKDDLYQFVMRCKNVLGADEFLRFSSAVHDFHNGQVSAAGTMQALQEIMGDDMPFLMKHAIKVMALDQQQ